MALPPHRGVGCAHARGNSSREARRHFHRGGATDGVARNHPARRVGHRLLARAPARADVRVPAPQYRAVVARAPGQVSVVHRAGQSALDDGQLFLSVVAALCDARSREPRVDRPAVRQRRKQLAAYQRRVFGAFRPPQSGADARSVRAARALGAVFRRSAVRRAVALVFSRHTQDNYAGGDTHGKYFDAVRGFYCALLEAHIPFDVISDKFLDAARLARYRVLVLPNMACVDDSGTAAIEAFVAAGGAAVATFDTGMRTRDGAARAEPAFAKMFGVTVRGRRSDLKSSYARIENAQDPLVTGIGDTDLIPNEGALVEVTAAPGRSVP